MPITKGILWPCCGASRKYLGNGSRSGSCPRISPSVAAHARLRSGAQGEAGLVITPSRVLGSRNAGWRCSFGPMSRRKRGTSVETKSFVREAELRPSHVLWLILAAIIIGGLLYSPALHGWFVFDDEGLPFRRGTRTSLCRSGSAASVRS